MSITNLPLEGKVAIVTGGGTGIGRAIALQFARAGANVVVASRRLSVLEKVGKEVKALGRRSLAVPVDITRKADIDNLAKRVVDEFGAIDILVNNAGVLIRRPLLEATEDEWDQTMNTDLKSYWLCSQAVGKRMVERRQGSIINIASVSAFRVNANTANAYAIAKAGVVMLTKCLALELGKHNIRVNAIAPGGVKTEMSRVWWSDPERLKQVEARIPLGGHIAEPDDIAAPALFLASDAARHVSGDTLIVNGGESA